MCSTKNCSAAQDFLVRFWKDFTNKQLWKLKAVYFFLLTGIVILWTQLTIHQSTLNLTDRDIANFVAVGSILGMFVPFMAGLIADKIGNYSFLVSVLMILMGMSSFMFTLIPPAAKQDSSSDSRSCASHNVFLDQLFSNYNSSVQERLNNCLAEVIDNDKSSNSDQSQQNATKLTSLLHRNCSTNLTVDDQSYSYSVTYWSYMFVRTTFMMLTSASFTAFDSSVMAISRERNIDYGFQRAWGTVAALVASYCGGYLVDFYSIGKEAKDYTLMFFGTGVCCIFAGIFMFLVDIKFNRPATNFRKDISKSLNNFEVISLLIIVIFKGCLMGYAETFMYLFMHELGASAVLIGLTVTVGAAFEIVLQIFATSITGKLGKINVIAIGILCYGIRFIGFSYIYQPEMVLVLEIFDSWASGLTTTAINLYLTSLSCPSTLASLRGLAGALEWGIGKYIGVRVGVEIKEHYGPRLTWKILAVSAVVAAVVYATCLKIYQYCMKRRTDTKKVDNIPCSYYTNKIIDN